VASATATLAAKVARAAAAATAVSAAASTAASAAGQLSTTQRQNRRPLAPPPPPPQSRLVPTPVPAAAPPAVAGASVGGYPVGGNKNFGQSAFKRGPVADVVPMPGRWGMEFTADDDNTTAEVNDVTIQKKPATNKIPASNKIPMQRRPVPPALAALLPGLLENAPTASA